jgi:molecular chaperone DnaK (HSP70)
MNGENPLSVIHQGGVADVHAGRRVRVLGIDLGTTNSTVSECVRDVEGVRIRSQGEPTPIGVGARNLDPSQVLSGSRSTGRTPQSQCLLRKT